MDSRRTVEKVKALLQEGVEDGVFTGCQAAWVHCGEPSPSVCAGQTDLVDGVQVSADTLFDIASLTKVAAASAAFRLVQAKVLSLEEPLEALCPSLFARRPLARATVVHLLAHEAGLPAWEPFYSRISEKERGTKSGKQQILEMVRNVPLNARPGHQMQYSDLGHMLLGELLEQLARRPLSEIVESEVTGPLGLGHTAYRKTGGSGAGMVASTERCPWRLRVMTGEVHDDNAWAMGGVAGHAGLFSTARDVAALGAAWLRALDQDEWLDKGLAILATTPRRLGRTVGFDCRSADGYSAAGTQMGTRTFGHLGFTGCSLWVDPDAKLSVALLSNRIHPTRDNLRIRAFSPAFHDLLFAQLHSLGGRN